MGDDSLEILTKAIDDTIEFGGFDDKFSDDEKYDIVDYVATKVITEIDADNFDPEDDRITKYTYDAFDNIYNQRKKMCY